MKNALSKKKKKGNRICLICWVVVPVLIVTMLILDGLRLYTFTTERLIVIGMCILVMLIPFFKEITIKNISIKRESDVE